MGLLIFLVLFTISGTLVAAFQCNPPKYAFELEFLMSPERSKYCYSSDVAYGIFMYQAVLLFVCDIIIFLLPFPALINLNMGSAKKTALLLVFGSGAVACIAPAVRFESIQFYKSGSSDTTCKLEAILFSLEFNQLLTILFCRRGCGILVLDGHRVQPWLGGRVVDGAPTSAFQDRCDVVKQRKFEL